MTRGNPHLQVTPHAVVRARQRYGLANIDWLLIHDDVYAAIMAGRAGKEHPNGTGRRCPSRGLYAWTPNRERAYVVVPFVNSRGRACLRVITSLPGCYGDEHMGSYRRARRRRAA